MNSYINDFTSQLKSAINIGDSTKLVSCNKKFNNIVICGLGGSGIGGTIISDILNLSITIPIVSVKDYSVPNFINNNTLVIINSYSGNTEETLSALKKCEIKNAEIAIITSGGKLKEIANKKKYNIVLVPGGHPPRAMLAYSFTEFFYILNHYNIIDNTFKKEFHKAIKLLDFEKENIKKTALNVARKLYDNTPVIYATNGFEGVAVRFRQQINENSKMLCWHHIVPEMNHNELLGWRTNTEKLAVIYLRNDCDYERNKVRIDINKDVIKKYTNNISEVWSKGDSIVEKTLYHINTGDWISWYLSEMNNVDAIEIDVINYLKDELSKI